MEENTKINQDIQENTGGDQAFEENLSGKSQKESRGRADAKSSSAGNQPHYIYIKVPGSSLSGRDKALICFFLGADAVFFGWITGWFYLWAAVLGLICGIIGVVFAVSSKKSGYHTGVLSAGLILSIIGLAGGLLAVLTRAAFLACTTFINTFIS